MMKAFVPCVSIKSETKFLSNDCSTVRDRNSLRVAGFFTCASLDVVCDSCPASGDSCCRALSLAEPSPLDMPTSDHIMISIVVERSGEISTRL